jgi:hypothetical protein
MRPPGLSPGLCRSSNLSLVQLECSRRAQVPTKLRSNAEHVVQCVMLRLCIVLVSLSSGDHELPSSYLLTCTNKKTYHTQATSTACYVVLGMHGLLSLRWSGGQVSKTPQPGHCQARLLLLSSVSHHCTAGISACIVTVERLASAFFSSKGSMQPPRSLSSLQECVTDALCRAPWCMHPQVACGSRMCQ